MKPLRFLLLEPFCSGSHRDFAEGLTTFSRHAIARLEMPGRFWKWRMRGAALYFIQRIDFGVPYDGLIVSSLMSLTDLKALWKGPFPPTVLYFHENQLSYPLSPGESMDFQYGFTNITGALAADGVLFNSAYHRRAFLSAVPGFIRRMPDCRPGGVAEAISAKSGVCYPGCCFSAVTDPPAPLCEPPLIVWNHRWEHDKNPEAFFHALAAMQRLNKRFRLALLGQRYTSVPQVFHTAPELLGDRLIQYGPIAGRTGYHRLLAQGAIVISTALQENFGIAVIEAIRHGCLPLLPDRLSYPELLPAELHARFLYADQRDLEAKLAHLLENIHAFEAERRMLAAAMERFAWPRAVAPFDAALEQISRAHR